MAGYGGVIALDRVSISAGTAAITAVLGANGAGKTTLLRAISGMIRPRRGRVLLDGTDLAGRNPEQMVRAGIAHVPEGQAVIPELTVEENLRVGMMSWPPGPVPHGPGRRARRGLRALPAAGRPPPQASRRAVRRRAADARHRPGSAGAAARAAARRAVARPRAHGSWPRSWTWWCGSAGSNGITIILVEQNARGALAIADHGVVLNLGRVVAAADAATLAADVALRHHYLGF